MFELKIYNNIYSYNVIIKIVLLLKIIKNYVFITKDTQNS